MSGEFSELTHLTFEEINQLVHWPLVVRYLAITAIFFSLISILGRVLLPKLEKVTKITHTHIDDAVLDVINSLSWLFYLVLSLYISSQFVVFSPVLQKFFNKFLLIFFTFYFAKIISLLIEHGFKRFLEKKEEGQEEVDRPLWLILKASFQLLAWSIAGILILENLGLKVSTLIGGLGVASIIIAFGVKSLLEDVLSFISITIDKPFVIGDYIVVGSDSGTVDKIDLHSTSLRTPSGEQLIIPNRELIKTPIKNYRRMEKRRDDFKLKIDLDLSEKKLQKIPQLLEEIINSVEGTEFGRCYFKEITPNAFVFSTVYYIPDREYSVYIKIKQEINLEIVAQFRKHDIKLAEPIHSQTG